MAESALSFEETARLLGLTYEQVARLLLAGTLRFEVGKRSPNAAVVLGVDVLVAAEDVQELLARRWTLVDAVRADALVNRAALKFGKHPTRDSPGVRGPSRRRSVS